MPQATTCARVRAFSILASVIFRVRGNVPRLLAVRVRPCLRGEMRPIVVAVPLHLR
jgi:hypothetical protein